MNNKFLNRISEIISGPNGSIFFWTLGIGIVLFLVHLRLTKKKNADIKVWEPVLISIIFGLLLGGTGLIKIGFFKRLTDNPSILFWILIAIVLILSWIFVFQFLTFGQETNSIRNESEVLNFNKGKSSTKRSPFAQYLRVFFRDLPILLACGAIGGSMFLLVFSYMYDSAASFMLFSCFAAWLFPFVFLQMLKAAEMVKIPQQYFWPIPQQQYDDLEINTCYEEGDPILMKLVEPNKIRYQLRMFVKSKPSWSPPYSRTNLKHKTHDFHPLYYEREVQRGEQFDPLTLGRTFMLLIKQYNESIDKNEPDKSIPSNELGFEEDGGSSFHWRFRIKSQWNRPGTWLRLQRYLNGTNTLQENKIENNDIILAKRVRRRG